MHQSCGAKSGHYYLQMKSPSGAADITPFWADFLLSARVSMSAGACPLKITIDCSFSPTTFSCASSHVEVNRSAKVNIGYSQE